MKKRTSLQMLVAMGHIEKIIFGHPDWARGLVNKKWHPFEKRQIVKMLNKKDARVLTLQRLAKNLGTSIGHLLNLGDWEYDEEGLPSRIRALRKNQNCKIFAKKCGLSNQYIREVIGGATKCCIRLSVAEEIARGCGIPLKILLSK